MEINSNEDEQIEEANKTAFDSLMSCHNKATRDWIVEHVSKTGISMRSRHWIPAVLAARTYLDMHWAAEKCEKSADALATQVKEAVKANGEVQQRLSRESTIRATFAQEVASGLDGAVDSAIEKIRQPIDEYASRIETTVVEKATRSIDGAAVEIVRRAEAMLSLSLDIFLERFWRWIAAAGLVFLLLGGAITHWLDTLHPAIVIVDSNQRGKQHGK